MITLICAHNRDKSPIKLKYIVMKYDIKKSAITAKLLKSSDIAYKGQRIGYSHNEKITNINKYENITK